MADYRNCTCIACRNKFEPDDDIVVCPECGTPYHRDCWNENGHCINTELHENGGSWKNPETSESEDKRVICPSCGKSNPEGSTFCIQCGKNINENRWNANGNSAGDEQENGYRGMFGIFGDACGHENPHEDMGGAELEEVKNFVGKNVPYFVMRFRYFRDSKKKLAPNFVCMLFPQFWFAYRKMWFVSLLVVLATFILAIPGSLITLADQVDYLLASIQPQLRMMGEGAEEVISSRMLLFEQFVNNNMNLLNRFDMVFGYISFSLDIVFFLFGNYMYYRHCIKKICAVRESRKSLMDLQSRIRIAGGTSIGYIFIAVFANMILTSFLIYISLML
ncbi:MAG: RING finger protein [Ruminococcus sp.]